MTRQEALAIYRQHGLLVAQMGVREDVAARLSTLAAERDQALDEAAKWRRLLGYVTSCPACGSEPGCNIDCATCMDWP